MGHFTFRVGDPGASTVLRTWAKGVLYETQRRANEVHTAGDMRRPGDDAARKRAEEALAAADAIDAGLAPPSLLTTPTIRADLQAWVSRNPDDGHARLVGLLLADFERNMR
jgi:hypothetical protein